MFSMGISARIVKRIITLLIVILGVVTLSFCLQIFTGTDPAEMLVRKTTLFATEEQIQAMRVELGLDGTLSEQYADYIKGLLTGDLGISITNRKPVIDNIRNALPVTCMLVIMSMLWVAILTVLISAFSVIWKDKAFDHATRVICIIGICVPSFWLALILLIAFAVEIPIFSVISDGSVKSLILPSISIAIPIACISIRVLRAAVINELKSDYVTYAKARGFSTSKIVYGEVLRNAFPSAITLFAQYTPAGFTHRFRPVVGGVIGVLAGYAVQNGTLAGTIYKGAVRVFHIPAHGRLAIPGIFRGAEHDKGSLLLADLAVECFVGHGGVGVQFVGAVVGLLPVLSGVVVTVLLGGKGGGHHADAQNHGQQQGRHALQAMPGCLAFQAFFPPFV